MKKQLNIQCGTFRRVYNMDTDISDEDIVRMVDCIEVFEEIECVSRHDFKDVGDN